MRELQLGDIIDDYCAKCKRLTNHSVVSILNAEPAKVRCRTCYHEHDYRHAQLPPARRDPKKQALFKEVLSSIAPDAAAQQPASSARARKRKSTEP